MAETPEKSLASPAHNRNAIDGELLVRQFKCGDDSAFDRIVKEYCADISALANRLLGWPGDVEDVVQNVFLSAFLGLKKFRCQCSLRTWLFTITINKCRTYRYKQMLRRSLLSRAAARPSIRTLSTTDKTPINYETFERIRKAVTTLPPKYREPVVLKYLQGLSTEKISKILGISRNTVAVRLTRARQRLKRSLAELMEK